jgi:CheY-like chemotaxis protein
MLRDAATGRRIRVETDVDPGLEDVRADEARVRLVTYNFLSNAIKFSRERGRVSIRMLPEGESHFRIEVEDSGIGHSEAEVADALRAPETGEAFRGEEAAPVGIGLAATKQIVEAEGGRIGVHSVPGRGSVFFAVLPRSLPEAEAADVVEVDAGVSGGARRRDRRVLVVAEDASTRAGLCWTLGHVGYEVVSAVGAEEGLHIARERACEVIAVDLLLAEMAAVEFVATLRAEGSSREVPCIVAALGSREVGVAGLLVADLLPRPAPADRLFAALERAKVRRGSAVLVSDGDLELCKAAAQTLGILGYRAVPQPDAHEALKACAEDMPAAIVMSPFLLGLDPFSFLHHLRQLPGSRDLPILLLVPRALEEAQIQMLREAAVVAAREGHWHRGLLLEGVAERCPPTSPVQAGTD